MSFRITGLPAETFAPLFYLSDAELAAHGAVRKIADGRMPGYPCRVSLTDSQAGDELLLQVADDGAGLPDRIEPGQGLRNMERRALELGGDASVRPGEGADCGSAPMAKISPSEWLAAIFPKR